MTHSTLHTPRVLYKYRSLTRKKDRDHTRQLIVDRKLYCASVDEFNDPFDCQAELVVRRGTPVEWKALGFPGRPPREFRQKHMAERGSEVILRPHPLRRSLLRH